MQVLWVVLCVLIGLLGFTLITLILTAGIIHLSEKL